MTYIKLAIGIIIALAIAAFGWKAYHMGATSVQAKWDADTLQAIEDDNKTTKERMSANAKLDQKFQREKADMQVRIADTDAALGSLRDTLESTAKSDNPPPACRIDAGRAERELLGQCAAVATGLAKEADRLESKLNGLQDYVKQVVKP